MATETLRPNAAGDETNIEEQFPSSGAHWDKVDESAQDEDTFVQSNEVAYERDFYDIPDSTSSGTINGITVYVRCYTSEPATQASAKIAIKSGTGAGAPDTPSESGGKTLASSITWETFSHEWLVNPATSAAFTWDEIDKLQIGVALRRSQTIFSPQTRCTQVYVEVDYEPTGTVVTPPTLALIITTYVLVLGWDVSPGGRRPIIKSKLSDYTVSDKFKMPARR